MGKILAFLGIGKKKMENTTSDTKAVEETKMLTDLEAAKELRSMGYSVVGKDTAGENTLFLCSKGRKDVWFEVIEDEIILREDIEPPPRPMD